jgi:hypothetical protein
MAALQHNSSNCQEERREFRCVYFSSVQSDDGSYKDNFGETFCCESLEILPAESMGLAYGFFPPGGEGGGGETFGAGLPTLPEIASAA